MEQSVGRGAGGAGVVRVRGGVSDLAKGGDQFAGVWLGSFCAVGLVSILIFRRALFIVVRRWTKEGRLTRRTAIVGGGDAGEARHLPFAGIGVRCDPLSHAAQGSEV